MATVIEKPTGNADKQAANERRLAAIFLTEETPGRVIDLTGISRSFYEKHRKIMPEKYGLVSGLRQLDENGKRTLPPHEGITFDARMADQNTFGWEISYADGEHQKIVRLQAEPDQLAAHFIELNSQGSVLWHFPLGEEVAAGVASHLAARLKSPEVNESIAEVYARRRSLQKLLGRLARQQKEVHAWEAQAIKEKIAMQQATLARTGIAPLIIFEPSRLSHADKF